MGGMGGGHYIAEAKSEGDGRWYCFDDSHVTKESGPSIRSSAYVLFFAKEFWYFNSCLLKSLNF